MSFLRFQRLRPRKSSFARYFGTNAAVGSFTDDGKREITVARGDGIGPEIMDSTLRILEAAKAPLSYDYIDIGENVYLSGITSGITPEGWESLERTGIFLKAPITTPLGGGVKSLNVTVRKTMGLYANVRPVFSYHPYVKAIQPNMDLVVIRENEEDLYAGIEHRHTSEVTQCLKLITVPGCIKICRYAFEYARAHGRKKITCVTKNNIMKITDGLFADIFKKMAAQYPDIETEHRIVDIATAHIASKPESYDMIVTTNLYGDIMSDVAAEVAGSVGLAGSANIGDRAAMFEAVHGSAPDIAGQDIANPAGLINGAVMMLTHLGYRDSGALIKNALLRTIEDGLHTADIYRSDTSKRKVGCKEFTDSIIERLGEVPREMRSEVRATGGWPANVEKPSFEVPAKPVEINVTKELVGVDIFVDWEGAERDADVLASLLEKANDDFELKTISNRGVKVWPNGHKDTYKVNHWRCRFMGTPEHSFRSISKLMKRIHDQDLEVIKTENLYNYNGQPGYSMVQGQ